MPKVRHSNPIRVNSLSDHEIFSLCVSEDDFEIQHLHTIINTKLYNSSAIINIYFLVDVIEMYELQRRSRIHRVYTDCIYNPTSYNATYIELYAGALHIIHE